MLLRLSKATLPIVMVAAVFSTADTGAQPAPVKLEIGMPFPDLVLPSLEDGRPVSFAEFRGQKVVLQVFASW